MRLFLGIDLPDEIKDYLFNLQSGLKNSSLAKVAWESKYKFHITLKFLGDVPDGKIVDLKNKLKDIKLGKFKLKLTNVGYFPGGPKVNVVWIGVTPEVPVTELQKLIDYETLEFGSVKFGSPHITLGRIKFIRHRKGLIDHLNNIKVENFGFNVGSFTLYKSTLTKDGSVYDALERYDLL